MGQSEAVLADDHQQRAMGEAVWYQGGNAEVETAKYAKHAKRSRRILPRAGGLIGDGDTPSLPTFDVAQASRLRVKAASRCQVRTGTGTVPEPAAGTGCAT